LALFNKPPNLCLPEQPWNTEMRRLRVVHTCLRTPPHPPHPPHPQRTSQLLFWPSL
jgi:hypothetical protein